LEGFVWKGCHGRLKGLGSRNAAMTFPTPHLPAGTGSALVQFGFQKPDNK